MKRAIVTGAAGFTGAVLTEELLNKGIEVCAVVRPSSAHNERLNKSDEGLRVLELDPEEYDKLPDIIGEGWDVMFHLKWTGDKELEPQMKNIRHCLSALESAKRCGCKRFIGTGSQAEYGIVAPDRITTEELPLNPFTAYGAAKAAAYYLSKKRAEELEIDWIWGRIFSLIGKYEPVGRMLPDLYHALKSNREMNLSSCTQNWDYLDVHDGAEALIALAERGRSGEAYNIAKGDYKPLKEFVRELEKITGTEGIIKYGEDPNPYVSLQPSVEKIKNDTGWQAVRSFAESVVEY